MSSALPSAPRLRLDATVTADFDDCTKGRYQDLTRQQSCKLCAIGFYTGCSGRPVCDACERGTTTEHVGATFCVVKRRNVTSPAEFIDESVRRGSSDTELCFQWNVAEMDLYPGETFSAQKVQRSENRLFPAPIARLSMLMTSRRRPPCSCNVYSKLILLSER